MGKNSYQYNKKYNQRDGIYGEHYRGSGDSSRGAYGTPSPFPSDTQKQFRPQPKPQQTKSQQQYQQPSRQKPAKPRMSKDKALQLTRFCKKSLLVASIAAFATFSGVIATYQASASTGTKATRSTKTTSTQQNGSSFLRQQGNNHIAATPTAASAQATVQATPTIQATPTPLPTVVPSNTVNIPSFQGPVGGSSVS